MVMIGPKKNKIRARWRGWQRPVGKNKVRTSWLGWLVARSERASGQGLPKELPVVSMLEPPLTFERLSTETKVHVSQDLVEHS